jgi:hypothetical protein
VSCAAAFLVDTQACCFCPSLSNCLLCLPPAKPCPPWSPTLDSPPSPPPHSLLCLPGSLTDYKYALLDATGNVLALQAGNSGVLAVRMADQRVEVQDSW